MVISAAPLVSIVTPVYNGSEYLEQLIQSVRNQDYPNIEHIIIDDGSQDHGATVAVLRRFPHLRWWSQSQKGQYATMNEGLLAAGGELVCFVSADDVVTPGAVSSVMEFWSRHADSDGVFGLTGRIDGQGKMLPYYIPFQTASLTYYPYFAHISHCSLYVKKESLTRYNLLFDPSLRYVGDYEWMMRLNRARLKIDLLPRELSKVRLHADQTSRRYTSDSRLETQKVMQQYRINKLSFGFFNTIYWLLFRTWYFAQVLKKGEMGMVVKRRISKYRNN